MKKKVKKTKMKMSKADKTLKVIATLLTIFWISCLFFPIYWLVVSSFKDATAQFADPPQFTISAPQKYTLYVEYDAEASKEVMYNDANILLWQMHAYVSANVGETEVIATVDDEAAMSATLSKSDYMINKRFLWDKSVIRAEDIVRSMNKIREMDCVVIQTEAVTFPEEQLTNKYTDEMQKEYTEAGNLSGTITGGTYCKEWSLLFENYKIAWDYPNRLGMEGGMLTPVLNTIFVAVMSFVLMVFVSSLAAYGISKLMPSKLKTKMMLIIMASGMIPATLTLIPKYIVVQQLQLNDSLWAIILPAAASFGTVLLFKGTFDAYPDSVIEASRIDGATEMQIYVQMVLPSTKALLGYFAIQSFAGAWDNFFWPSMVIRDIGKYNVSMVLNYLLNGSGSRPDYAVALALGLLISIPTLVIYALFQKTLNYGFDYSGLKG